MEPDPTNAIKSELQRLIVESLDGMGMTNRKFAKEFPDYSTATYGTWKNQRSVMGLDALETILYRYPKLWYTIAIYLGIDTEENLTSGIEPNVLNKQGADSNKTLDELIKALEDLRRENGNLWDQNKKLTDILGRLVKPLGANGTQ